MTKAIRLGLGLLMLTAASNIFAADGGWKYVPVPPMSTGKPAPYSEGLLAGHTFYIAGHIGADPTTHRVPADASREAHLVMEAIEHTLSQAGLSLNDLVSVSVFCTDLKLYGAFNDAYRSYFHGPYPPRVFIGVSNLLGGAHFEVEGIALKH